MSILCPAAFNVLRFPKLFQRLRRAIRAGVNWSKLLLELHVRAVCSQICELTLNQLFLSEIPPRELRTGLWFAKVRSGGPAVRA